MKRISVLFYALLLLALTGCQKPALYNMSPGSVEVFVEGDGEFPEFLVGRWKGDKSGWGFVFGPDGTISEARIAMGRTKIIPGEITTLPTLGGGKAVYIPGNWSVQYSPDDRELTVEVVMNYIRIEMDDNVLQGKEEHILTGSVSEDGTIWWVTVCSFPEFEGFPTDPNDLPYMSEVDFVKVEGGI